MFFCGLELSFVFFVVNISMLVTPPGGGKNTHENNAEKASCKEACYKTYHIVIPFKSRSLANDLVTGFSHFCASDKREHIFSF